MEYLTTEELAKREGVKPQSVRSRLCLTGSYFGLKPNKRPNGRLIWSYDFQQVRKGS